MQFHQWQLDNGLQIITEVNPRAHSVAIGFFVRAGSRDEPPALSGVSHFLEHMAFKGNEEFSADDVNRIFDEVGARYNASTSEELTLFYAAILPEYLPRTFRLLSALMRPSLRTADFTLEQQVILEEIGMYEDAPSFLVYDQAMQTHFAGHPLGNRILGTIESVSALTADQMRDYHHERYVAGNITLAVAGNIDLDELRRLVDRYCACWPAGVTTRDVAEARPVPGKGFLVREQAQQQHLMQLAPAPAANDPRRFAAELLSMIVGDESGSPLYWEIVDPGFAEAAELGYSDFDGSGAWMTYISCDPDEAAGNVERVASIFKRMNRLDFSDDELTQARNKLSTRIVLASERPMGRLSSLGGNWIYHRGYRSVQDDLATIQALSRDDIAQVLETYPLAQTTTAGVGPLADLETI